MLFETVDLKLVLFCPPPRLLGNSWQHCVCHDWETGVLLAADVWSPKDASHELTCTEQPPNQGMSLGCSCQKG